MSARIKASKLSAGYGRIRAVRDFSVSLEPGEVVALLGPNGAGKTTTLLALAGLLTHDGEVAVDGESIAPGNPVAANQAGIVLVPDNRALFGSLTVEQHLQLGCEGGSRKPEDLLEVFPALEKRWELMAGVLSGGEQQMLAVARALAQDPAVLLLDEMSMGLAPIIVESLLPVVKAAATEHGAAVVVVEQHVALGLQVSDRAMVMAHGEVVLEGLSDDLASDRSALEAAYLG